MRVRVLDGEGLYQALRARLGTTPFKLFIYMLTESDWMSLLSSPPQWVRERSEVYLDRNKASREVVERLTLLGYSVWLVPDLHAKAIISGDMLVVGSANLTGRSFRNIELNVVIENPGRTLLSRAETILSKARVLGVQVA